MRNKKESWETIIVVMLLFFPVGIFLLAQRVNAEKDQYLKNGKRLILLGIFCVLFGILCLILGLSDHLVIKTGDYPLVSMLPVSLVCLTGGVVSWCCGRRYEKRGQVYADCVMDAAAGKSIDLSAVAAKLKLPFGTIHADLQYQIDQGCIPNACIDIAQRRLIVKARPQSCRQIICKHCGGTNLFDDVAPSVCGYCDSPIITEHTSSRSQY